MQPSFPFHVYKPVSEKLLDIFSLEVLHIHFLKFPDTIWGSLWKMSQPQGGQRNSQSRKGRGHTDKKLALFPSKIESLLKVKKWLHTGTRSRLTLSWACYLEIRFGLWLQTSKDFKRIEFQYSLERLHNPSDGEEKTFSLTLALRVEFYSFYHFFVEICIHLWLCYNAKTEQSHDSYKRS